MRMLIIDDSPTMRKYLSAIAAGFSPGNRTCATTACTSATISRTTPIKVAETPTMAGHPVVLIETSIAAPAIGYAPLRPMVPWQYPKISPNPATRKTTEAIKLRSEFIAILSEESYSTFLTSAREAGE